MGPAVDGGVEVGGGEGPGELVALGGSPVHRLVDGLDLGVGDALDGGFGLAVLEAVGVVGGLGDALVGGAAGVAGVVDVAALPLQGETQGLLELRG